jgi:outer membrane protein assembly factor BamB
MTRLRRRVVVGALIAFAVLTVSFQCRCALAERRIIADAQARQLGLQRAWFAQVQLDRARNRVERAVLADDRLTVMTSAGVVHELNALTGESLWTAPLGNPQHPSLGPAANAQFVALLNGSTLYVLDRADGRPVLVRPIGGAPGAAPALAEKYVFVPLATGRIEAYPLGEKKLTPWYYQSFGRAMVAPLATPDSFVWTTDRGYLYVGRSGELGVRFRLETGSEIVAPPAYHQSYVYAATVTGEVFSINEITGARRWKYATGFPVLRTPAAVDERVFVTSEEPVLHCIDAMRGVSLWEVPNITQFAAASSSRVYCTDKFGALVSLDATTGAVSGRMPTGISMNALVNDQTDRVYLVSDDGMVQCLHELGAEKPHYHQPKVSPTEPAAEQTAPTSDITQPPAVEATEPAEEEPAEETEMPEDDSGFGVDEDDPFGAFNE